MPPMLKSVYEAGDQRHLAMAIERGPKLVICIAGMTGSGKSTVAKCLAEEYGLKYVSGGNALKALAVEIGYKTCERGWWESEEGSKFLQHRTGNLEFDRKIDEKLMEQAKEGNIILDSWTMPWLLKESFKIWLEASPDVRTKRTTRRDRLNFKEALTRVKEKDEQTRAIYQKLYGFDLGTDFSPFDFILDTNTLEVKEVFETICIVLNSTLRLKPRRTVHSSNLPNKRIY